MKAYQELTKEELLTLKAELNAAYEDAKGKGLKLDMSRGKPAVNQLDMTMDFLDVVNSQSAMKAEDGMDVRNYGGLDGIPEAKKPMHVFGFLGSVVLFIAFLSLIGLGIDKMIELHQGVYGHLITDSPYFFIALTAMLLGSQLFLAGFLGDLISRQNPNRNDYQIEKEIRCGK